jgi:polyphosphate glucokinase
VKKRARGTKAPAKIRKILVIDVGGTHVKVLLSGKREPRKLPSGPHLTATEMVAIVREATTDWDYDAVTVGFPGPVLKNRPTKEPVNLGDGWVGFDFAKAFGKPVKVINDAAMQAVGSYDGGRMLFLGLGTGLGTALVIDGHVIPLEIAHLPYHKDKEYEEYVGEAGLKKLGKKKWKKHVETVVRLFLAALNADYAVIGGGNVRFFDKLPPNCKRGSNRFAFRGGFRLWQDNALRI